VSWEQGLDLRVVLDKLRVPHVTRYPAQGVNGKDMKPEGEGKMGFIPPTGPRPRLR
jgi:hypothetical protein